MVVPPTLSAPPGESGTYIIPKDHLLLASPAVAHKDPRVWKDAETWDPYRWTDPTGVAAEALSSYDGQGGEKVDYGFGHINKGTESSYQPFGAGRHRCIGEQVRRCVDSITV
jgi:sterol 14alpha-demethylase